MLCFTPPSFLPLPLLSKDLLASVDSCRPNPLRFNVAFAEFALFPTPQSCDGRGSRVGLEGDLGENVVGVCLFCLFFAVVCRPMMTPLTNDSDDKPYRLRVVPSPFPRPVGLAEKEVASAPSPTLLLHT
jgi:hypothetical protein